MSDLPMYIVKSLVRGFAYRVAFATPPWIAGFFLLSIFIVALLIQGLR